MSKEINTYEGKVFDASEITFTPDEANKAVDKAKLYPTPVNADKGKYLKYDESGNLIYDNVPSDEIPTITITAEQVVSQNPIRIQLTEEQYALYTNETLVINWIWDVVGFTNYSGIASYDRGDDGFLINLGRDAVIISKLSDENRIFSVSLINLVYTGFATTADTVPVADGVGGYTWKTPNREADNVTYLTTAPSSANTDGLKFVVLSTEPSTKYSGYVYLIVGG